MSRPRDASPSRAEPQRVQRFLARAGFASRREADRLVAEGKVTVNGAVAEVGQVVDPARDVVAVEGRLVAPPATATWLVLHKPAGVVTSRRDPQGRPTVFGLVDDVPGLTYVGRLDLLTEGVLLLTTDGDGAHRLTHPSAEVPRTYVATVRGELRPALRALRDGVELDDGMVFVDDFHVEPAAGRGRSLLTLTLHEGRNREVRRLCEALGLVIERLVRVAFGPVTLGALEPGAARALTTAERAGLLAYGVRVPAPPKGPRAAAKPAARPTAGAQGGRPAGKSAGKPTGKSAGKPTGKSAGKPAGKPTGKPAGKPAGKPTGKPAGKPAGKPTGKPTGKPAGKAAGRPGGSPPGRPATPRGPARVSRKRDSR